MDTKLCVVANSIETVRVIAQFLDSNGIKCVGAGILPATECEAGSSSNKTSKGVSVNSMTQAAARFSTERDVGVYQGKGAGVISCVEAAADADGRVDETL